jgi:drug/metabolite transporter (DMT)-like permease
VPIPYAGQLAALGTASCWVASSLAFEAAARRVGSLPLNLVRLVMAAVFLGIFGWFSRGLFLPLDASPHAWLWLSVSGLVGFTFGDLCLFRALVLIGPRLAMLLMSLAPLFTVLIGWAVLGETLGGRDLLGMGLIVGGVAWAVLDREPAGGPRREVSVVSRRGIALGVGGALGQAGGLVLSKLGMGGYDPFASTQVRVIAGMAGYVVLMTVLGMWPRVIAALGHRPALGFAAIGSFFGPFLGVSLSLVSVQLIAAGVASSLMATTPILIIPVAVLVRREHVGAGGVLGALLAVAGVVLLFL